MAAFWDKYIVRVREQDPKFWTAEEIATFFAYTRSFRERLIQEDADATSEIFALGVLFTRDRLKIPRDLKKHIATAANVELRSERLENWSSPKKRKRAVEALLTAIGVRRKSTRGARHPVKVEVEQMRKFNRYWKRWARAGAIGDGTEHDENFQRLYPSVLHGLQKLLTSGTTNVARPLRYEAQKYRLMSVAHFTGMMLGLSDKDILALVAKAESTEGKVPALGL